MSGEHLRRAHQGRNSTAARLSCWHWNTPAHHCHTHVHRNLPGVAEFRLEVFSKLGEQVPEGGQKIVRAHDAGQGLVGGHARVAGEQGDRRTFKVADGSPPQVPAQDGDLVCRQLLVPEVRTRRWHAQLTIFSTLRAKAHTRQMFWFPCFFLGAWHNGISARRRLGVPRRSHVTCVPSSLSFSCAASARRCRRS